MSKIINTKINWKISIFGYNLIKNLYQIAKIPSDSYLRERLDSSWLKMDWLPMHPIFHYPNRQLLIASCRIARIWHFITFYELVMFQFESVLVLFFTEWGGITLQQALILQSWFMGWMFLLEIPTGTVADYFGRKISLVLSQVI